MGNSRNSKALKNAYQDMSSIMSIQDLQKRKMTLTEYQAYQDTIKDLYMNNTTTTFMSTVADRLKNMGLIVTDNGYGSYAISIGD